MIASSRPVESVARELCLRVERIIPGVVCSVLALDLEGVHALAGPSLPVALSAVFERVPVAQAMDSFGAAMCGSAVELHDVEADPRWALYKGVMLAAGLRASWSSPIKGRDGRVLGSFALYYRTRRGPTALEQRIVATAVDLCALAIDQHAVWATLEETNQRFDVALTYMSQGLCFFDGQRRLIVANRRYSEIYELPLNEVVPGVSLAAIVQMRVACGTGPSMAAQDYLEWRDNLQLHDTPSDTVVELANGRVISIHHQPMPDGGWVATHEDITERRRNEAQIVHMARHDALTGLPNRLAFHERIDQALAHAGRGQGCAVLCVDLDQFKDVNDTLGHSAGDRLLQQAASRLQSCIREVDTITRLGGDEFAVLLLAIEGPGGAAEVANRIVEAIRVPFDLDGHSVVVGASIGIAIAPQDGATPVKLLKSADTAMYRAKEDDRGTFRFFESEMDARLQSRLILEQDLRRAVRDEQFTLVYQPLVNLESNSVSGFEALLRWRHQERGPISPAEFIPLAEETGLILPIGAWVLRQACAEAACWPTAIKLAVNLSAVQFRNAELVETVRTALAEAGLLASRLELEITESVLLRHNSDTLATLHDLRRLGVGISLDDFGTGYSSLRYLRSFPFDKIKIDQSFVRDLLENRDSIAIIRAVVGLGRSLGMATTAEGVETAEQLELVRREGCTEVQGFLFSRPVGPEQARRFARPGVLAGSLQDA